LGENASAVTALRPPTLNVKQGWARSKSHTVTLPPNIPTASNSLPFEALALIAPHVHPRF
jgi:hypothetical protein